MEPQRESLRRKRSSRLAAVQCIYNAHISGKPLNPERAFAMIIEQWKDSIAAKDDEWPSNDMPEHTTLKTILEGVSKHQEELDIRIAAILQDNWKIDRMDPVVIACLRCAAYELAYHEKLSSAVIVDEYTSIASGFAEEAELNFVHGALQNLKSAIRS